MVAINDNSILIVAFDGLDYELIQRYDCQNVIQDEFGQIDNNVDGADRVTWPLFASFVTGEHPTDHGVTSFTRWNNDRVHCIESFLDQFTIGEKTVGLRKAILESINSLGLQRKKYTQKHIETDMLFDLIPGSQSVNVPVVDVNNVCGRVCQTFRRWGLDRARREMEKEYYWRRQEFWDAVTPEKPLLMAHFHYPDFIQHYYGDHRAVYDRHELEQMYQRIDTFAEQIRTRTDYDHVLFMSDHGLPEGQEHNTNAFYSCNSAVFGSETPHITDFFETVMEWANPETAIQEVTI